MLTWFFCVSSKYFLVASYMVGCHWLFL